MPEPSEKQLSFEKSLAETKKGFTITGKALSFIHEGQYSARDFRQVMMQEKR
jgi:hypothetical protein